MFMAYEFCSITFVLKSSTRGCLPSCIEATGSLQWWRSVSYRENDINRASWEGLDQEFSC